MGNYGQLYYITLEKKSFVTARNIAFQELTEAANFNFEASSDNENGVLADEPKKTPKKNAVESPKIKLNLSVHLKIC